MSSGSAHGALQALFSARRSSPVAELGSEEFLLFPFRDCSVLNVNFLGCAAAMGCEQPVGGAGLLVLSRSLLLGGDSGRVLNHG